MFYTLILILPKCANSFLQSFVNKTNIRIVEYKEIKGIMYRVGPQNMQYLLQSVDSPLELAN